MEYVHSISVSERDERKNWLHILADAMSRIRFQLCGGILFAVAIPAVIRVQFERFGDQPASYEHSLIGTVCALLLGYLIFRKMTVLPGARAITNVAPAFLTSFAVVITFFFLLRIDYSRYQFLVSFTFACIWFAIVLFTVARFRRPIFYVLPGANTENLLSYQGVKWRTLKSQRLLDRYPHIPIVVDLHDSALSPEWERIVAEEAIKGRRVLNARQLEESLTGRAQIGHLSENSFGHLAPDSLFAPTKRYIDLFAAILILAVFWPLMLIVAAVIKMGSPGPALFKQKRMGFRGKTFTVYKFRSMRESSVREDTIQSDKTADDDDRITAFGRFIRKTRIDELPQILNIIRGDMSWIGPRPETMRLSKWYESEIPFYRYRHIVRPGISGWAQVKQGHVTDVEDIRLKLEYDMYYVKHFSVWLDLLIVVKTILVVFTGKGAR